MQGTYHGGNNFSLFFKFIIATNWLSPLKFSANFNHVKKAQHNQPSLQCYNISAIKVLTMNHCYNNKRSLNSI